MILKEINKILEIIENKRTPILIIFSIMILLLVFNCYMKLFPQNWIITTIIVIIITPLWFGAIYFNWQFLSDSKKKIRLVSYLQRHGPYHSFKHIEEQIGYSEKITKRLISKFPEELNDTPMSKYGKGVGLNSTNKK